MKVTIEQKEGNAWRQVQATLFNTKNNNAGVRFNGSVLIFQDLQEGAKVLAPEGKGWKVVGRVTRNHTIFLGEGLSYSETNEKLFSNERWEKPVLARALRGSIDTRSGTGKG